MLKRQKKQNDAFLALGPADRRRLMMLGARVHIMQWVLAFGKESDVYPRVISFPPFAVSMKEYVCDAVAVSLPEQPEDIPMSLEPRATTASGLFVHVGPAGGTMSWMHVDNLPDEDVVRLGSAVQAACEAPASSTESHMSGIAPP